MIAGSWVFDAARSPLRAALRSPRRQRQRRQRAPPEAERALSNLPAAATARVHYHSSPAAIERSTNEQRKPKLKCASNGSHVLSGHQEVGFASDSLLTRQARLLHAHAELSALSCAGTPCTFLRVLARRFRV